MILIVKEGVRENAVRFSGRSIRRRAAPIAPGGPPPSFIVPDPFLLHNHDTARSEVRTDLDAQDQD